MQSRDSQTFGLVSVLVFIGAALVASLSSCATVPSPVEFDTATLHGMVYDDEHNPVQWASVSIAGREPIYTDIDGRFAVPGVVRGVVTIEVGADGFAPHTGEFLFANRTQVLYLRLHSGRSFVRQAIGALDSGDGETAVHLAGKALMVLPADPVALFIAALASYRTGDLTAAQSRLSGFPNTCGYEAVRLFRADLAADIAANLEVE